jgi:hypothetical protein
MHWTRLFIEVKKSHQKMAFDTFNICIKDLLSNNFVDRTQVLEKGKKVDYFLIQKGKQYVRLLLNHTNGAKDRLAAKIERRKILLFLLFLFRKPHDYVYRSEQEFRDLLSWNKLSENDLLRKIPNVEFKDGKTITTTHFESDSGIYVWRIDTLDEGKNPPETTLVYKYDVPGLSKTDILESHNKPAFWHINFTEDQIQDMFDSLRDEKDPMFRIVAFDHNGEPRYDISDQSLKKLLDVCGKINNVVDILTQRIWKYLRKPTDDERKWLELVGGKQRTEKMCRIFYEKRKQLKNDRQMTKWIEEETKFCNNNLNKIILRIKKNYANVIEKYQFPLDELMEIICPKFLQSLSVQR